MPSATNPVVSDPRLEALVAEDQAAVAAGQPLAVDHLLARHPDAPGDSNLVTCPRCLMRFPNNGMATPNEAPPGPGTVTIPPDQPASPATPARPTSLLGERWAASRSFATWAKEPSVGSSRPAIRSSSGRWRLKLAKSEQMSSASRVERFQREAQLAANLMHPQIVAVFDSGQDGPHHYIATAFVSGRSLAVVLEELPEGTMLPLREAVEIVRKLAEALAYAHKEGVMHRDIKPGNVMVREDGEPLLMDFGLAARSDETEKLTVAGQFVGTPEYSGPEQWRGQASAASDQYSLGCLLFELVTGRVPFRGGSNEHYMLLHTQHAPPAPRALVPSCPRDVETICLKCLEKEPARRYADCQRLADDLRRWLEGEPIQARPPGFAERALKWTRRRPALASLVLVSACAVLALGVLGWVASLRIDRAWQEAEVNAARADALAARAEAHAAEEHRQRDKVLAFRKRQDTVDGLFVRIDRRLENQGTGLASVRMEFLKEFLKLNEELLREGGKEPAQRRQTAQLYQRVGDLESTRNDFADGVEAYQKAIALFGGLIEEGPAIEQDRAQLAHTWAQLAQFQRRARRYLQARKSYQKAIEVRKRLVTDYPRNAVHRYRTASYYFWLADLLDEWGKAKDAEAFYRLALADQEQLVKDEPAQAAFREDMLQTAGSLAVLLESSAPDESRKLLERISRANRDAARTNPDATWNGW